MRDRLAQAGGHWVSLMDCHNASASWKAANPDARTRNHGADWEEQRLKAREWLEGQGWVAYNLDVKRESDGLDSPGLVFGHLEHLKTLTRRGYLTLMDSTHHTNGLKWPLYNIFVRDEHGSWVPGAHILCAYEDSDIVAAGLQQVSFYSF